LWSKGFVDDVATTSPLAEEIEEAVSKRERQEKGMSRERQGKKKTALFSFLSLQSVSSIYLVTSCTDACVAAQRAKAESLRLEVGSVATLAEGLA
jgi:hypothetical protein